MEELKNYGEVLEEVKKSLISLVEHEIIIGDYETFLLQLEQAQTIEDCGTVLSSYLQVSGDNFINVNVGNYINNTLERLGYSPVNIDVPFLASTPPKIDWSEIENKPTTFTPTAHEHPISEVTNLQETINLLATKQEVEDAFDELATLMGGV